MAHPGANGKYPKIFSVRVYALYHPTHFEEAAYMKNLIVAVALLSFAFILPLPLLGQDPVDSMIKKQQNKLSEIQMKSEEHQRRIIEKFNKFYNEVKKFAPDIKLNMPVHPGYADTIKENNHPSRKNIKQYFAYVAEPYRLRSGPFDSVTENSVPVKKGAKVRILMMPDLAGSKAKNNITGKWALVKTGSGDEGYIPLDMLLREIPSSALKSSSPSLKSGAPVLKSQSQQKKEVTVSSLNVRTEPGQDAPRIDSLSRGSIVDVLEYSANEDYIDGMNAKWAKIRYRYLEGWVFSGYLGEVTEGSGHEPNEEPLTDFRQGQSLYVKADLLRVRDIPKPEGTVLFSLKHSDKIQISEVIDELVTLAGKKSRWVGIKHQEYEGYVFGAFLGTDSSAYIQGDDIDKLFIFPFNDPNLPITSNYGWRTIRGQKNFHKGIDIGAREGTPVLAAADGAVISIREENRNCSSCGYGNMVLIQHNNGHRTLYGHLSRIGASMGQKLSAGEELGRVGNTGHSYGAHLHFEIIAYEEYVDPSTYMHAHLYLLNDLLTEMATM